MPYFLAMTWMWWLVAIAVAVIVTWLIFRGAGELATARARISELEGMVREIPGLRARIAELETDAARPGAAADDGDPATDMRTASAIIGARVDLNDLAVVEGIGPKIRELLHGSNIRTWRELSTTPVAMLNQILDDAGPRFRMHDPSTWPRQAGLLADGHWARFKEWTDELKGGREAQLTAK